MWKWIREREWVLPALLAPLGVVVLLAAERLPRQTAEWCEGLATEIMVWERCNPREGCMASLTEQTQLVKKIVRCQEAVGARKDSGSDSR